MPRKHYTPEERAIHLIGALAGKSLREINDAIAHSDAVKMVPGHRQKELPQTSLDLLKRKYAAALVSEVDWVRETKIGGEVWSDLWDHCLGPKKLSDL
jgi:hypothetical protein